MSAHPWMLYGAYGYTGEATAREAVARGERPLLAGRREEKLAPLAEELGLEFRAFPLDDPSAVDAALADVPLVAHCAGPFVHTAAPMREGCLRTGTHYLDITGEISVFVATRADSTRAREAGVVLMSGTGFDVIPSDCLALHLKERLPSATRLELAFYGTGGVSRGTSMTVVESSGQGGAIRKDGKIVPVPTAWKDRDVSFSTGVRRCVSIPWGDVATAFFSTGIPNITVYMGMPPKSIRTMRWGRWVEPLTRLAPVKGLMRWWVDRNVTGPTPEVRLSARSHLWGRVEDDEGGAAEATLDTPEGYRLTVLGTLDVARRVLAGEVEPGSWTPAEAFGSQLVLGFEGVELTDR